MRVIVIGAGAMGTLFGTTLIKGGHEVVFLDSWQPLIYAVSQDSVATLKQGEKVEKIPVQICFYAEPPEKAVDLIIVFVKSSSTKNAIETIASKGVILDNTVILTCQGGFDNPEIISSNMKDPALLLHGCTKSTSKSSGPMTIENFSIGPTTVWPYKLPVDQKPAQRVFDIVQQCNEAGLNISVTTQAIADRWKMLLSYPTTYAVSAVSGFTFGDVWATAEGRNLLSCLAKEVALIAKKEGIDESLFNEEIAIKHIEELALAQPNTPGSMLLDIKAHRITEIDATSGTLIRKAISYGLELPYMSSIWSIMRIKEQNFGCEFESR